jgi:calcineurin-like phosphoesterase family protein
MKIYVTADEHLGHDNIVKFRPRFQSTYEMDDTILREQEEVAKYKGVMYHIGDTAWKEVEYYQNIIRTLGQALLGMRHIFLQGSHDRRWATDAHSILLFHEGLPVWLVHDPLHANPLFPVNLVGHVHHNWKVKVEEYGGMRHVLVNVGVDRWNFKPVRIEDAIGLAKNAAPELFTREQLLKYNGFKKRSLGSKEEEE